MVAWHNFYLLQKKKVNIEFYIIWQLTKHLIFITKTNSIYYQKFRELKPMLKAQTQLFFSDMDKNKKIFPIT